jgi:hypothetical protein
MGLLWVVMILRSGWESLALFSADEPQRAGQEIVLAGLRDCSDAGAAADLRSGNEREWG